MRLDQFTVKAQEALTSAQTGAEKADHPEVTPEHLLKALLELLDEARSRATFGELPPLHPQPAEEAHTT